jgi:hypothetical protein
VEKKNFNRINGVTAIEKNCPGKHRHVGESELAWRKLIKFKHGLLQENELDDVVLPGLRYFFIQLGMSQNGLHWQQVRKICKGAFNHGACLKSSFIRNSKSPAKL